MDTLQVFQTSQSGGSRHSSRTPSPSRYEHQQSNWKSIRSSSEKIIGKIAFISKPKTKTKKVQILCVFNFSVLLLYHFN
jgi:hypothetical protein